MVEGVELFVIDIPITLRAEGRTGVGVGCWVPGDSKISYIHSMRDDCEYNIGFPIRQTSRQIEHEDNLFFLEPGEH